MKYWAYVNNEILGPFEKEKLLELPAFTPSLLICPQTPVGEKTEDWKEASVYPEISAIMGIGAAKPAPAPAPAPTPAPQPAAGSSSPSQSQPHSGSGIELKPLTAAAVEPVPPISEHSFGQINLEVGHLERSGRMPAAQPSTDPITLSSISRKADTLSGNEGIKPVPGVDREPQPAFGAAPAAAAPVRQEAAAAPQGQAMAAGPELQELSRKVDALAANAVGRQDIAAATDPLRMKLDQMGEVLSSMKNAQFQREIMDKLAYLENAIGDIKFSMKESGGARPAAASPAPGKLDFEPNSATVFGAQPQFQAQEKPKPEPAAAAPKPAGIVDQGAAKSSKLAGAIGGFFRKLFRLVMTLVLLVAVALVSVFALKKANVFDATKFIPFPIPFLTSPAPAAQPAAEQPAEPQAQVPAQPEAKKEPDVSPEVVYFVRYYAPRAGGPKLEDKITEVAAAAGASYSPANWQAKSAGPDMYEAAAVVPGKTGNVTFTYTVDFAKKTLTPVDENGKAAFDALTPAAPAPRKGGKGAKKRGAAAKPAAEAPAAAAPAAAKAPAARKPAAETKKPAAATKKVAAPDEDYEYVYEDEEAAGQ